MEQTIDKAYLAEWVKWNEEAVRRGFTWGTLEEQDDFHQYMSLEVLEIGRTQHDRIRTATNGIGSVLNKTYKHLLANPELIDRLGIPEAARKAVLVPSELFSYFTRLDLIVNGNDIRLIEVNCDTPTGYLESSVANAMLCERMGVTSPNELEMAVFRAWRMIERAYGLHPQQKIFFTSYGEHEEDRRTVLFNMEHSGTHGEYVAVEDIVVNQEGLFTPSGERIDYLYRLYPLEFLPEDVAANGDPVGKWFLDHIAEGRVTILNPPSAFLMQSKAVMALVWELYEKQDGLYDHRDRQVIRDHFLPTYFDNRLSGSAYVEKPIFGREGGGVEIRDDRGSLIAEDGERWYREWPTIYQAYQEMPDHTVHTWSGAYTGKLLVGSFYVGGEASGLFLRVGEKITGNLSMFCGVTVASR